MNDMRKLLSAAFPPPEDEPQQRDVVGAAMEWGERRRRREWTLGAAAALAVVAVGAGAAAVSGGSGGTTALGGGPTAARSSAPNFPAGTAGTELCNMPNAPTAAGAGEYCRLFNEMQDFDKTFALGAVKYIQAALPQGYTVRATDTSALILTGPQGTNYLWVSATSASTLDGRAPGCGTQPQGCVQTTTAGGTVVVRDLPSAGRSAGWVKDGLRDPRITVMIATKASGGINGIAAPTADQMLTDDQLVKITGDDAFIRYATTSWARYLSIQEQLRGMTPPSATGSSGPGWSPTGSLPATGSSSLSGSPVWPSSPGGSQSSWPSSPGGSQSSWPSSPGGSQSSWPSSPGGSQSSWPSSPGGPQSSWPSSPGGSQSGPGATGSSS